MVGRAEWIEAFDDYVEELVQDARDAGGVLRLFKREHVPLQGRMQVADLRLELRFQPQEEEEVHHEEVMLARWLGVEGEVVLKRGTSPVALREALVAYLSTGWSPTPEEAADTFMGV